MRSNAELIGRTANLDLQFWGEEDLAQIAIIGFPQLNVVISPTIAKAMAIEACGSPQLMQELCLQSCFVGEYREASEQPRSLVWDPSFKRKVLEQAAENASRSDVLTAMHRGVKIRGTARKTYKFVDSSVGDVYTAVLLAIKSDPPTLEIRYKDLMERVQNVCLPDNYPSSSSIVAACQQLEIKAKLIRPNERIVEWESRSATLSNAQQRGSLLWRFEKGLDARERFLRLFAAGRVAAAWEQDGLGSRDVLEDRFDLCRGGVLVILTFDHKYRTAYRFHVRFDVPGAEPRIDPDIAPTPKSGFESS